MVLQKWSYVDRRLQEINTISNCLCNDGLNDWLIFSTLVIEKKKKLSTLGHAWIGYKYLRGKKSQTKKTKLINEKLVKFDCCGGGRMVAKWWKIKISLSFVG